MMWARAAERLAGDCRAILPKMDETNSDDLRFMQAAVDDARAAGEMGEVPVGAVIVIEDEIVTRAGNRTIVDCDPTAHAEIVALREAAQQDWELSSAGGDALRDD